MRKNFISRYLAVQIAFLFILNQSSNAQLVTNTTTLETFATIQAAIDDVNTLNGHTLTVAAGVYAENILINKSLTINGPKIGVDGNDGSRGTNEAVIYPATASIGDGTYNGGKIINITADNVTLDGLTIDGDNPSLTGYGFEANGVNFDVDFGVSSHGGYAGDDPDLAGDNIIIKNNIIRNFFRNAVIMWCAYSNPVANFGEIKHNKIQNVPYGQGIFLMQNYYAAIENNTFIDNNMSVFVYFFWLAKPSEADATISHNSITTKTQNIINYGTFTNVIGIRYHFIYSIADPWTISNNTLTNTTPGSAESIGIEIDMDWTAENVQIFNNNINSFQNGYRLVSSANPFIPGSSALPTTVAGGILSNNTYGITAGNSSYNGNATPAFASIFDVNGVSIQNSTVAGIFVQDSSISLTLDPPFESPMVTLNAKNCKINGNPTGILLKGGHSNATAHDNDLSGNTSFAINNISPNVVNATCNWYGHWTGPYAATNTVGQGKRVSDNVTYDPWLINGTDNSPAVSGFQPVPGSCVPIRCGNNNKKYLFCHNGMTKCFGYDDALIHISHGDPFGACGGSITSTGEIMQESVIPENFTVTNYPNPFINSTTLRYELPYTSKVSILIYDAMGKEVASLINAEKQSGIHTYNFEAGRLGSGVYLYKMIIVSKEKEYTYMGKLLKQ